MHAYMDHVLSNPTTGIIQGGPGNTVLNFYLVDFVSPDGTSIQSGWIVDYSPPSRVRALAIKYRVPGRLSSSEFTPEEMEQAAERPLPRAERAGENDGCVRPDRACVGGWF